MFNADTLERIVIDQAEMLKNKKLGTLRDIDFGKYLKTKQIIVITSHSTILILMMNAWLTLPCLIFKV